MKRRKINRNRRYRGRRYGFPWKIVGLIVLLSALVVGGIFAAKGIHTLTQNHKRPAVETSMAETSVTTAPTKTTQTTAAPEIQTASLSNVKAFTMTAGMLQNKEAREKQVVSAAKAGFTGVVFELKDENGLLSYQSSVKKAKDIKAISEKAISVNDLKNFKMYCEKQGVLCIPKLYCFLDPLASRAISDARVLLSDGSNYVWLDNSQARGGKPWLNPYAPSAHAYLQGYIKEISEMGFEALLLDGVQFPYQTYMASYGNTSLSSLSKVDVLKRFVTDSQKQAGSCTLIPVTSGLSVFTDTNTVYGGNPLNFGAKTNAPEMFPSDFGSTLKAGKQTVKHPEDHPGQSVALALSQTKVRLELMGKNKPAILPILQGFDLSEASVNLEIKAVQSVLGKDAGFILDKSDDSYQFDRYGLSKKEVSAS